jgi:hypothetical protein
MRGGGVRSQSQFSLPSMGPLEGSAQSMVEIGKEMMRVFPKDVLQCGPPRALESLGLAQDVAREVGRKMEP